MSHTILSVVQMSLSETLKTNLDKSFHFIEQAAQSGSNIVLLPELFENHYFCQTESDHYFSLAHEVNDHPFIYKFQTLAKKLNVVIPLSFFEKSGQHYYNSLAFIDNHGELKGIYRKSHIPDGPYYEEKYYFKPGNTGFKVWKTEFGNIGIGICWDQWFPECARALTLQGADVILYPTAIGSEPPEAHSINTKNMWQRAMIGHAVCNSVYIAAANRIGIENNMDFYGSSFICDYKGDKCVELDSKTESVVHLECDFATAKTFRAGMGFFRDRRADLYSSLVKE